MNGPKLCLNCLKSGHRNLKRPSNLKCFNCGKSHHTLLHEDNSAQGQVPARNGLQVSMTELQQLALLATAIVRVRTSDNKCINCRQLVDQRAQACCVTEELVQRLGLIRKPTQSTLHGLKGQSVPKVKGEVALELRAVVGKFSMAVGALILPKLTGNQPSAPLGEMDLKHLNNLQLSDINWMQSRRIDILLDASVYAAILKEGVAKGPAGSPIGQNTELG